MIYKQVSQLIVINKLIGNKFLTGESQMIVDNIRTALTTSVFVALAETVEVA